MVGLLNILLEEAIEHEDADKRMVINLSKHIIERIAVVDHLSFTCFIEVKSQDS